MSKILDRILGRLLYGSNSAPVEEDAVTEGPHPAKAPVDSEWARQRNVDFFVNPAMTMDTLSYLSPNGSGPEGALRERYGLPPQRPAEASGAGSGDDAPA
jgi:hypothetical protein